ncbi:hypothetical protein ACSHT0_08985 [Tepidicaulis sp. LMO-SS28]|uniref:hypothetical protein n=1 Tax=Tepidicaulis sp. LMO-SS28 TaxID=3447455 RepID=UPI003EE0C4CC
MAGLKQFLGAAREGMALWGIAGFCAVLLAFNISGISAEKAKEAHAAHAESLLVADSKAAFADSSTILIAGAIAEAGDPAAALKRFIASASASGRAAQRELGEAARLAVRMAEAKGDLKLAIAMSEVWIAEAPLLSQDAFQADGLMTASTGKAASDAPFADTQLSLAAHKLPERKVLILYLSNVALLAVLVLAAGLALMQRRRGRAEAA